MYIDKGEFLRHIFFSGVRLSSLILLLAPRECAYRLWFMRQSVSLMFLKIDVAFEFLRSWVYRLSIMRFHVRLEVRTTV